MGSNLQEWPSSLAPRGRTCHRRAGQSEKASCERRIRDRTSSGNLRECYRFRLLTVSRTFPENVATFAPPSRARAGQKGVGSSPYPNIGCSRYSRSLQDNTGSLSTLDSLQAPAPVGCLLNSPAKSLLDLILGECDPAVGCRQSTSSLQELDQQHRFDGHRKTRECSGHRHTRRCRHDHGDLLLTQAACAAPG